MCGHSGGACGDEKEKEEVRRTAFRCGERPCWGAVFNMKINVFRD